jgi:hypothetical protein
MPAASRPPRSGNPVQPALRPRREPPEIGRIEAIHERGKGSFVSDTTTLEPSTAGASPRRSGALTAMRLAELQGLASSMGISGTAIRGPRRPDGIRRPEDDSPGVVPQPWAQRHRSTSSTTTPSCRHHRLPATTGPNDVYVPLGMVKRHGLRKGDAVTGAVKAPRDGEEGSSSRRRPQPPPEVQPAGSPRHGQRDDARGRPPPPRVRQAHAALPAGAPAPGDRAGSADHRIIDLVAPIGKGQRGLIVAPPRPARRWSCRRSPTRSRPTTPRPPHGRARRRAPRGGHRHAAHGQG